MKAGPEPASALEAGASKAIIGPARLRAASASFGALSLALAVLGIACVPARGGWDGEALLHEVPEVAALRGHRLFDMVPFPALVPRADGAPPVRVALVVCRFAAGAALRVRAEGPAWSDGAGDAALSAFADQLTVLGLSLVRTAQAPAELEIQAFEGSEAEAPEGLGDTLVECDVEHDEHAGEAAGPRGLLQRAEIRLRRTGLDAAGRARRATDEAWVGALLHELAHALGFSGHAATGDSLLVRDESRLRDLGRAVLRGAPLSDPTLAALHHLRPGQTLGERPLTAGGAVWVREILSLDARRRAAGIQRTALLASVGDREARLSLRYSDGSRLGLRFPGWAERLRAGGEVLAWPDQVTLEAILAARASGDAEAGSGAVSR